MNALQKAKELLEAEKLINDDSEWFVSPVHKDEYDNDFCTIGPFDPLEYRPSDPYHYEDTIAEFWGGNFLCKENAKFVVLARNNGPEIARALINATKTINSLKKKIKALKND